MSEIKVMVCVWYFAAPAVPAQETEGAAVIIIARIRMYSLRQFSIISYVAFLLDLMPRDSVAT
jgi:hypothetical protein